MSFFKEFRLLITNKFLLQAKPVRWIVYKDADNRLCLRLYRGCRSPVWSRDFIITELVEQRSVGLGSRGDLVAERSYFRAIYKER